MTSVPPSQPPGWYYAQGDPPGTQRYWDGTRWQGGPQAVPGAERLGSAATGGRDLALWRRLIARWLDFFILLIPSIGISFALVGGAVGVTALAGGGEEVSFAAQVFVSLLAGAISIAYEYFFLLKRAATPGKMIMGIEVVNDDGSALSESDAGKRVIIRGLTVIPIIGGLIWLVATFVTAILVLVDDRNQGLADKLAGTIVVMKA